ncbi:MAG TPA: GNAT family N-acetyltransferase [Candidatus Saccharimonadaceae bacterium]|jgi:ribosomal protein S18 acetylase RimI-like enzyme|nr:GNAT family N-acetyltransferase [Candidatus Saccharimonadaceae bacterium]
MERDDTKRATVDVRHATPADVPELAALGVRTFAAAFAGRVGDDALAQYLASAFSEAQIASELAAPGSVFLIARDGDTPVGYARVLADEPHASVPSRKAIRIVRIYVEHDRLGTGLGAALMNAVVSEARHMGGDALWLRVWEKNHRAIRFYERAGFRTCATLEFEMMGSPKTDLVMWRSLA